VRVGDLVTWKFDANRVGIVIASRLVPPTESPYSADPYRYPEALRGGDILFYRAITVCWSGKEGFTGTYFLSLPISKNAVLQLWSPSDE